MTEIRELQPEDRAALVALFADRVWRVDVTALDSPLPPAEETALERWLESAGVRPLMRRGAVVTVHDPEGLANARVIYKDDGFIFCDTPEEAAKNADALVIATNWACYKTLDWPAIAKTMRQPLVFDARNMLRGLRFDNVDIIGL